MQPLRCPGRLCLDCQAQTPWTASFCPFCGSQQAEEPPGPFRPRRPELLWSAAGGYRGPMVRGHRLLAVARCEDGVDVFHPEQQDPWLRLPGLEAPQALFLADHLLFGWNSHQLKVWQLTPQLYGSPCRVDRNTSWNLTAPPICPPVHRGRRFLWASESTLECLQLSSSGLEKVWQRPVPRLQGLLVWGKAWLTLERGGVQQWSAAGEPVQRWAINGEIADWWAEQDRLLMLTRSGQILQLHGGQLETLWSGSGPSFALGAHGRHLIVTRGNQALVLTLDSGQSHSLDLLHPCVLKPLVHESWALLPSYDGTLYQLSLGSRPAVVAAYTLSSSYEPSTRPPLLWGERLFELSPEGELRCWKVA